MLCGLSNTLMVDLIDNGRIDFGNLEDEHTQLKEEFARWRNTHEGTGWSGPDGGNIITSRYQGL
eukprot:SAG31_NODE_4203_length_3477_cov_5.894316_2_plen_64_part_00